MRKELIKLTKHALIYGVGIVISKAVSFIMLPVYTNYLSPADYGTIELLSMTIDIISMIAGLGVASTVFKFYSEYESPGDKKEIISSAALITAGIALLTAASGAAFSREFSRLVFDSAGNAPLFRWFFAIYFLQSICIAPMLYIRALQFSKLFVLINLIKLLMQLSLNIYFVVLLKWGVAGVIYSTFTAELVLGVYLSYYMFRRVGFRFSLAKSKQMVKFGYPFIFVYMSSFTLTFSDRYFLNAYSNLETVGIYSLAYKFGFILGLFSVVPFMQVWETQRFDIVKQRDAQAIFSKVFLYFNITVISVSLTISIFTRDMLRIMSNPAYHEAYRIVPIIIVAYAIQAWTYHCNLGIYLKGESKYMAAASIASALLVTVLNLLLIPAYGAYGAAWATVGAFSMRFILIYAISQRSYRINYAWDKNLLLVALAMVVYAISRMLFLSQVAASLAANTCLLILFLAIIYAFLLEKRERSAIRGFIRNPLSIANAPRT